MFAVAVGGMLGPDGVDAVLSGSPGTIAWEVLGQSLSMRKANETCGGGDGLAYISCDLRAGSASHRCGEEVEPTLKDSLGTCRVPQPMNWGFLKSGQRSYLS